VKAVPQEITQEGIAHHTGTNRAHISMVLKELKEAGIVKEVKCHIKGASRKRLAYFLTPYGLERAKHLKEEVLSFEVEQNGQVLRLSELIGKEQKSLLSFFVPEYDAEKKAESAPVVKKEREYWVSIAWYLAGYALILSSIAIFLLSQSFIPLLWGLVGLFLFIRSFYLAKPHPQIQRSLLLYTGMNITFVVLYVAGGLMHFLPEGKEMLHIFSVCVPLFLVLSFLGVIPKPIRAELFIIFGLLFITTGFLSIYLLPIHTRETAPFWMLIGVYAVLCGREVFPKAPHSLYLLSSVGVSIMVCSMSAYSIATNGKEMSVVLLWFLLGMILLCSRFSTKKIEVVERVRLSIPLSFGVLFMLFAALLAVHSKYTEAMVEGVLGILLLTYGGKNTKLDILLLIQVLIVLTATVSVLIFIL